jgi:putative acetyltransferase
MMRAADHSTIPGLDPGIPGRKGTDHSTIPGFGPADRAGGKRRVSDLADVAIAAETPLQDDVRGMVAALNAYLMPLTPREFQFQLTAEQMAEPTVTVFVARDGDGRAIGMGALKEHGGRLGEVKRMFTLPEARGRGVGSLILRRIEALARERGIARLVLETGEAPGFEPAWRVYERGGFAVCGAVLDYPDSGYSRFYEKRLA